MYLVEATPAPTPLRGEVTRTEIAIAPTVPTLPPVLAAASGGITIPTEVLVGLVISLGLGCLTALLGRSIRQIDDRLERYSDRLEAQEALASTLARLEEKIIQVGALSNRIETLEEGRARIAQLAEQLHHLSRSLDRTHAEIVEEQKLWQEFRAEAGQRYAGREDFLRTVGSLDAKLDALHSRLDKLGISYGHSKD